MPSPYRTTSLRHAQDRFESPDDDDLDDVEPEASARARDDAAAEAVADAAFERESRRYDRE